MSVKVCTAGGPKSGFCMECSGTAQEVAKIIQEAQKAPNAWVCCGNQCIRASEIAIVTEEKLPPDDDDGDGPIIVGNPDVVIITGGQKVLPKRRAPQPEVVTEKPGEEAEPEGPRVL